LFWPNVKDKKMRVQFTCRNCKKESMISMEVDKIEYLEEVV
jgi:transcription elongation factor Elf1